MDEEIERLVVSVRADTAGFRKDIDAMRGTLEGPLATSADRAGRGIETALVRAVRTGKMGFEDLGKTALSILDSIAAEAVRGGLSSLFGGMRGGAGGGGLASLIGGLIGLPGRATGGPVSPGRAYMVGERGPEVFVPTSSGQVAAAGGGAPRDVRVSITIAAPEGAGAQVLQQSSRQVARAVKAAIEGA